MQENVKITDCSKPLKWPKSFSLFMVENIELGKYLTELLSQIQARFQRIIFIEIVIIVYNLVIKN